MHKTHIWNARVFLAISWIPTTRIRKDEIGELSLENKITVRCSFLNTSVFGSEFPFGSTKQTDPMSTSFPLASVHVSLFRFWGINILLSYIPNQWVSKGLFDLFGLFSFSSAGAKDCAVACACIVESQWKRSLKSKGKNNVGAYIYFEKRFRLLRSFLCLGCSLPSPVKNPQSFATCLL